MQLVEIVEIHVRFHLSQDKTSRFIVTTVFQTIDQKEAIVEEADLAETVVAEDLVAEEDLETEDHERCTRLPVPTVEMNVRFHSNQMDKNQFIVMNAFEIVNQKEKNVADISHFYTNNPFKN